MKDRLEEELKSITLQDNSKIEIGDQVDFLDNAIAKSIKGVIKYKEGLGEEPYKISKIIRHKTSQFSYVHVTLKGKNGEEADVNKDFLTGYVFRYD